MEDVSGDTAPRLREAVRALIVDEDDRVLLVRLTFAGVSFWLNPGGGIEPGEDRLTALARELREEVGIHVDALGPEVWTKTAHFTMGPWDGQVDHVHLVRIPHVEPLGTFSPEELLAESLDAARWWSREELAASGDVFAPREFPRLYAEPLDGGVPPAPIVLWGY